MDISEKRNLRIKRNKRKERVKELIGKLFFVLNIPISPITFIISYYGLKSNGYKLDYIRRSYIRTLKDMWRGKY